MIRKILIVDDSPVARQIIKKCLPEGHEYDLFEAGDGRAAVEKFKDVQPDVTLLDLTMPVMDGIQALEEIKKLDAHAAVIVVTADIQQKTVLKVKELGAIMVTKKPPSAESIHEALTKAEEFLGQ